MAFLTPDKTRTEHGLVIKEKIIPWGAKWTKDYQEYKKGDQYKADRKLSNGTGKVKYITIHNTDDLENVYDDGEQYTRATYPNQNMGDARVHYFIDDVDCWQNLREDEVGWHAGDSRGPGNETSLAIEIIMDGSGSAADTKAEDRGALLAAILLNRHGLGIDKLVTHKHWVGKNCPAFILPHWLEFEAKVKKYLAQIQGKADKNEATENGNSVKAGDIVSVASNAVYYNGVDVPVFVVARKWIVKSVSGDRAVIDKSVDGQFSINSPVNVKYLTAEKKQFEPYTVKLVTPIHKSASADSPVVGTIDNGGVYTIVEENGGWGKLKSGAGWISLDYTEKV